jgi:hypothetical protein
VSDTALAALAELPDADALWRQATLEVGDFVTGACAQECVGLALAGEQAQMAETISSAVAFAMLTAPTALALLGEDGLCNLLNVAIAGRVVRCGLKATRN